MAHPLIDRFLHAFLHEEAKTVLPKVVGIDIDDYINMLLARFKNPAIGDQISRLCLDGTTKWPKFLMPTIRYTQICYTLCSFLVWALFCVLITRWGHASERKFWNNGNYILRFENHTINDGRIPRLCLVVVAKWGKFSICARRPGALSMYVCNSINSIKMLQGWLLRVFGIQNNHKCA